MSMTTQTENSAASRTESCGETQPGLADELLPLVYQELRGIARRERRRLSGGETLATTALVNEAYVRLSANPPFASRGDFLRIAATAMRRILVDRVRAQMAAKRGGGVAAVALEDVADVANAADFRVEDAQMVADVHEALERLGAMNPKLVQVVECRFFAGYSETETAEALDLSLRTVQRDWALARAWLKKEVRA